MHYLKVPLFSFPHDLQGITTRDLGHVVLYESEIRNNGLIYCFIIHRHGVAPGCAWHGKCRWTWPWDGERMVSWGPHSKVAKLRLITCILPGQPPMGLDTTSTTAKLSALLNQRCKVVVWYIQYMVLLQELLQNASKVAWATLGKEFHVLFLQDVKKKKKNGCWSLIMSNLLQCPPSLV